MTDLKELGSTGVAGRILDAASENVYVLPASFAQQRLWFLDKLEPGSSAYNVPLALRFSGPLDSRLLEETLQEIVRRHEVLRTTFSEDELGTPVQVIAERREFTLPVVDLRGCSDGLAEEKARALIIAHARAPFDLKRGPLFSGRLFRIADDEHVLSLALHHGIVDGWSWKILLHEITTIYDALKQGQPSALPELPYQYADYAVWQQAQLQGERQQKLFAYWEKQLEGAPPVLDLPTDMPRPAVQTFTGAQHSINLPRELEEGLLKLSQGGRVTLFMTLLAAFSVLLARYSGQDDIVIGTPISGRTRAEFEQLIGFFVNTLVLRTKLSGNPSFRELLGRVRETTLDAYAHQDLPFEKLVERLHPERDLSRNPIFQVMLILENAPKADAAIPGLTIAPFRGAEGMTAKFDLLLTAVIKPEGSRLGLSYNVDLFHASTIARMQRHLQNLLEGIVANPDCVISELPLLSPEEREQIVFAWNQTKADYDRDLCLHTGFEQQAAKTPDQTAILFEGKQLSFRDLNRRANQLANYLITKGIGPGAIVGISLERSPEMVIAVLAILKAGAAYLPLDPAYPAQRLVYLLDDSRAQAVITDESTKKKLPPGATHLILTDTDAKAIANQSDENPCVAIPSNGRAYLLYTSGSTGKPKGVEGTHRASINRCAWMWKKFPFEPGEICCHKTTLGFVDSVWEIFGPLLQGVPIVVISQETVLEPEKFVQALARYEIRRLVIVPSLLRVLLASVANLRQRLPKLDLWSASGEAVSVDLAQTFFKALPGARMLNMYGSSETAADATWHEVTPQDTVSVPIGRPLDNTQIYVLDQYLHPVPVGVAGQIYVGGDCLALGYWNRPELTAERFITNPFSPEVSSRLYNIGDLGRYLPDGTLLYLGRSDHQVKIRGQRIELGEIESLLERHQSVQQAAVVLRENAGEQRLAAYAVLKPGEQVAADDLRTHLEQTVPQYMVPASFMVLDRFPTTTSGKINRLALPEPEREARVATGPRTEIEEQLLEVWTQVLGVSSIGIHDHFFQLGGHSLLATQIISRMQKNLHVEVPLRALFEHPTIAALAGIVDEYRAKGRTDAIQLIPRLREIPDSIPLSFAQQRLWVLNRLEPGAAYNLAIPLRLRGPLDVPALNAALTEIVRRHEALRTSFELAGDAPCQVVSPAQPFLLPIINVDGRSDAERETEIRRIVQQETKRSFDIEKGPLFRVTLLQLGPADHILLLCVHHIVSDGWSQRVLLRELITLYQDFSAGRPSSLPELPVQYSDFAIWQRQYVAGERLQTQLEYWKRNLEGAPPALDLPTDHVRPPVQSFRGAVHSAIIPAQVMEGLKQLSSSKGATLFMTLLSAFNVLLARYSGQEDIIVGSPIAGRNRLEVENLIGLFVSTLALRTDLSGNPTFTALLARVRDTTLGAFAHQDVPFERIVEELNPLRDLSRNPIFQVMFILQNMPGRTRSVPGLQISNFAAGGQASAKFDLTLSAMETVDGLRIAFEYSTDLFDAATIERMQRHFHNLLEAILAQPECAIADLPLMDLHERQQLVETWNQTAVAYESSLCLDTAFEQQAAKTPEQTALLFEGARISYRELNQRANKLAHYLIARGVQPGMLVGVALERSPQMVASLLAVLKVGAAYVPLDPSYPNQRLAFQLEDSAAAAVITERHLAQRLPTNAATPILLDEHAAAIDQQPAENPSLSLPADRSMYVIYTSGSTGMPKGVEGTHRAAMNRFAWMWKTYPFQAGEVCCQKTTLGFVDSVWEIFGPLLQGVPSVIIAQETVLDPVNLIRVLAENRVSRLVLVPSLLRALLDFDEQLGQKLPHLQLWTSSGELLPADLAQRFRRAFPQATLLNLYGSSEVAADATYHEVTTEDTVEVPIGRPIANTQIYLLDQRLKPVPVGACGQIYVGGDNLARGYWNHSQLTAERFIENPISPQLSPRLYQTGDLGRYRPDGTLLYVGRVDNQVKLRGYRIELSEIERVLERHASVGSASALIRQIEGEKRLLSYVVPKKGQDLTIPELRQHLQQSLPAYMVPDKIVVLEQIPVNEHGKIDYSALPSQLVAKPEKPVTPRNELELLLVQIWRRVLALQSVSVTDNFFELGGHSLLAVRLIAEIRKETGQEIPLSTLFEGASIENLARVLRNRPTSLHHTVLPVQPEGSNPPLFGIVVPGVNALGYLSLARHLGNDQPVYRIQGPGPRLRLRPYTPEEFEQLASEYIAAMKKIQPRGPYHLCGMCEGARIAFDMARLLEREGEKIGLLAILDTWVLENSQNRFLWKIDYYVGRLRSLWRGSRRDKWRALSHWLMHRDGAEPLIKAWPQVYWPGKHFVPAKYSGKITVIKFPKQPFFYINDPLLGWGTRTTAEVELHSLALNTKRHMLMFREPYVQHLAAVLRTLLERESARERVHDSDIASSVVCSV